jgi:Carboxypeptidase regulatory-like domain
MRTSCSWRVSARHVVDVLIGFCRRTLAAFVLLAALPSVTSAGQSLSGSLSGSVRDEQGGTLGGAIVTVSSPAQIGGDQRTTANDKGQWRFPVLAPGVYVLVVEKAPGFNSYREEGISIGAGASIERPIVLQVAGVTQSVTVEADSSVESRSSGFETRFGPEYLATIPTRRFSMFDAIRSAPGMSPTSPSSGTVNTVSSFGSGVNENAFLIDGTTFTCPCSGVSRAEPSVDVIQEVHVQSIGASVEFGNIQGAVINVVTRQGGERFQSQTAYYGQPSGLTAQPIVLPVTNGTQPSSGYERERYRDFSTGLGGPVVRERLWFYGAYQYLRDYDSQPGADPAFPRKYEQDKVFGKLTWRLTPSLQMMQSFHEEFWENPDPPTLSMPFETTLRRHASVPSSTFANVTYAPDGKNVWDLRIGRFLYDQKDDPSTGDLTTPNHRDVAAVGCPRGFHLRTAALVRRSAPSDDRGPAAFRPVTVDVDRTCGVDDGAAVCSNRRWMRQQSTGRRGSRSVERISARSTRRSGWHAQGCCVLLHRLARRQLSLRAGAFGPGSLDRPRRLRPAYRLHR